METSVVNFDRRAEKSAMSAGIQNYLIPEADFVPVEVERRESADPTSIDNLGPYQKFPDYLSPTLCIWHFMNKAELIDFLKISKKAKIREALENKLHPTYPSGAARILIIELMYNVTKFCKSSEFLLEQIGAVLSMFFLTHKYFVSSFHISAEKVYNFFKELVLRHSVTAPADYIKLFLYPDSKKVLIFFCSIYLRNLPLIRLLGLPNFGFFVEHKLLPEYDFSEKKAAQGKGKDKKGKGGKKDKGGKKGKKK